MNNNMKDKAKEAFFNDPQSRYNRFCRYCNHCGVINGKDKMCLWGADECYQIVRYKCPIPSAKVAMLMENVITINDESKGMSEVKKGGTVVPPSNFQFVTT